MKFEVFLRPLKFLLEVFDALVDDGFGRIFEDALPDAFAAVGLCEYITIKGPFFTTDDSFNHIINHVFDSALEVTFCIAQEPVFKISPDFLLDAFADVFYQWLEVFYFPLVYEPFGGVLCGEVDGAEVLVILGFFNVFFGYHCLKLTSTGT